MYVFMFMCITEIVDERRLQRRFNELKCISFINFFTRYPMFCFYHYHLIITTINIMKQQQPYSQSKQSLKSSQLTKTAYHSGTYILTDLWMFVLHPSPSDAIHCILFALFSVVCLFEILFDSLDDPPTTTVLVCIYSLCAYTIAFPCNVGTTNSNHHLDRC